METQTAAFAFVVGQEVTKELQGGISEGTQQGQRDCGHREQSHKALSGQQTPRKDHSKNSGDGHVTDMDTVMEQA